MLGEGVFSFLDVFRFGYEDILGECVDRVFCEVGDYFYVRWLVFLVVVVEVVIISYNDIGVWFVFF